MAEMRWRKTERLVNDKWEPVEFEDLKVGDVFRLFEDDAKPVLNQGVAIHRVIEAPVAVGRHGNYAITSEPVLGA